MVDPTAVEETKADQIARVVWKVTHVSKIKDEPFGVVFKGKA